MAQDGEREGSLVSECTPRRPGLARADRRRAAGADRGRRTASPLASRETRQGRGGLRLMQMHNGSAALLRARLPRLYVTLRRALRRFTRRPTWGPRKAKPPEHIGAYPIRSTEKLRFADTD